MKRCITAAFAAATILTVSTAPADDSVRLRIQSAYPTSIVQIGSSAKTLEETLNSAAGGGIEARLYEPGALVPALEVFDAVSDGSVDAGWSTPAFWQNKEPALTVFSAVPFGPSADEFLAWMWHDGGEEMMQDIYADYGIHSMICGVVSPEASGWFSEEITSVDQLEGTKMRFLGYGAEVMEKLGVETQLLAGGDVYAALERGVIDAAEFSMPAIDLNLGFHEIMDHYYFPGWHQRATMLELMINKDKWDNMSESQQQFITMACRANLATGLAEGEALQGEALNELEAEGVEFHRWSDEALAEFEAAWEEVVAEKVAEDETFKTVWESLQAFRDEYAKWEELNSLD